MKVTRLAGLCLALSLTAAATADGLLPIPAAPTPFAPPPQIDPEFTDGVIVPGAVHHWEEAPIELFPHVRYRRHRNVAPCAVSKIIQVNDPRASKCSCGPQCVFIEICVPPCEHETVRCRRQGDRLRFYYGKYKVDVRVKKGYITVEYRD